MPRWAQEPMYTRVTDAPGASVRRNQDIRNLDLCQRVGVAGGGGEG